VHNLTWEIDQFPRISENNIIMKLGFDQIVKVISGQTLTPLPTWLGLYIDVLCDGEIVVERKLLAHVADVVLDGLGLAGHVEAGYLGPPLAEPQ
jgi:hypothetical protein